MTLAHLQDLFQRYVLEGDARLLDRIFPPNGEDSAASRASIYAQAYRLRLQEALASNYPRLEQLLGPELFGSIAARYINSNPSRDASIRWFGGELAAMLAGMFPDRPWLSELARWEWAIASAFDAADAIPIRSEDLEQLAPETWQSVRFEFHPSVQAFTLHTNAPLLFKMLTDDEHTPPPSATGETHWLIWRQKDSTRYRSMHPGEATALNTMKDGGTFAEMCTTLCASHAPDEAALQAARLLRTWIDEELVCKVLHRVEHDPF